MHGLIHVVLKQLVCERFGEDLWPKILKEAEITNEEEFMQLVQHSDGLTVKAVVATSKVLDVPVDTALRVYGGFFAESAHKGGHVRLLRTMGDNFQDFLQNVNHMHCVLERAMRTAVFPYMKVQPLEQAEGMSKFKLSYCSMRGTLLKPVLEGVLPVVAERLFQQTIQLDELPPEDGAAGTWIITAVRKELPEPELPAGPGWWSVLGNWHAALMGCSCRPCSEEAPMQIDIPASATVFASYDTVTLEDMISRGAAMEQGAREELDRLGEQVKSSEDPASVLMRGVRAGDVAANWQDTAALDLTSAFWSNNLGQLGDYQRSKSVEQVDFFVTHCWSMPQDWLRIAGKDANYADVKTTELQVCVADFAESNDMPWEDVTLWIDKCCIPQQHALLPVCVNLIEDFVQRCDGMIVLLSWHYFSRLWCVYEWAGFLVYHDPQDVVISLQAFMRPASRHLFVEAVRGISVQRCQCYNEEDRKILKAKVKEYYYSEEAFEKFAQSTAIGLIASSMAQLASQDDNMYEAEFLPWVELAGELGFTQLQSALKEATPVYWRTQATKEAGCEADALGAAAQTWRKIFNNKKDEWFMNSVSPVLAKVKAQSVPSAISDRMSSLKEQRNSSRTPTSRGSLSRRSLTDASRA